jgi:hypothetical protein
MRTILSAARVGRRTYPGPIGELIERELHTYLDADRPLPIHSIPERLLTSLLPTPESAGHESAGHESGTVTTAEPEPGLPVRYRRGTPLHWEPAPRPSPPGSDGEG